MGASELLSPEGIWDEILSCDHERVLNTWLQLNTDEQTALLAHLERMVKENGWHEEQVASAQHALDAIHG
ncbi:MAG: hypothetical protein JW704_04815 [Anaerolineaceae bacterium]|nr:hypothetical protein [Anaerolineaceae bacterium]MBN2676618.1 hypothetical protein [Anaerolineaceae bacterium]